MGRTHLRTALATAAAVASAALIPSAAQAAPPAKAVFEGTITVGTGNVASALGAGYVELAGDVPVPVACPDGGAHDGVLYRFFDLKKEYRELKLFGPEPLVSQDPAGTGKVTEYDLDIFGFDAACHRIDGPTGFTGQSGSPFETYKPKKPVRYALVTYYRGPYLDIPVRVEAR